MPTNCLIDALANWNPPLPLAVAFSGGADSTALLWAAARRWPGQVAAIHVHHGLQAAADAFEAHCASLCAQWQVPLAVVRVDARHQSGQSPEDAARIARYGALAQAVQQGVGGLAIRSIALAQHGDDQIETVLLALSRGAGVAGLAGMPAQWQRDGLAWFRPLLGLGAADIRAALREAGVPWIEDPSNADPAFTRNRIRAQVLPALEGAFPAIRATLARSAAHAADAAQLLQELAAQDLALVGVPPSIRALQALSAQRQANVLRHWLKAHHQTTPSAAQLQELLRQLAHCTTRGHRIHLKTGRGHIERQGEVIDWYN
ncbi:MAG: tRNA lysidine(34) synthetase TilS [Comamonas sp.]